MEHSPKIKCSPCGVSTVPNLRVHDLRDQLNARVDNLRKKLSHPNASDLQRRLDQVKIERLRRFLRNNPEQLDAETLPADLRTQLKISRANTRRQIDVRMGGPPPGGESLCTIKEYHHQAITAQHWPTKSLDETKITFSEDDAINIQFPHNDLLLVELGIGYCDVTKVLIDTDSSFYLIFRSTLDKMRVNLRDLKPSSQTLTGFNGAAEVLLRTIRLPVHAGGGLPRRSSSR